MTPSEMFANAIALVTLTFEGSNLRPFIDDLGDDLSHVVAALAMLTRQAALAANGDDRETAQAWLQDLAVALASSPKMAQLDNEYPDDDEGGPA